MTSFSAAPVVLSTLFSSPLGWVIVAFAAIGTATVLTSITNALVACLPSLRHRGDRPSAPSASVSVSVPGEDALRAFVHGDDVPALIADALEQGAKLWGTGARMGAGEAQDIRTAISRDRGTFAAWVPVYRIGGDA